MTTTFEYENTFHGTSARSRYAEEVLDAALQQGPTHPAYRAARRVSKRLCGMADCTCSGCLGTRYD
jgi:hypothetical protein